ncbi:hypothetical protein BC940DRAFT_295454 [Gongronella butleri]|nr:hypothetical protein BC940DRAFT_295454 [Gongronella butleri]
MSYKAPFGTPRPFAISPSPSATISDKEPDASTSRRSSSASSPLDSQRPAGGGGSDAITAELQLLRQSVVSIGTELQQMNNNLGQVVRLLQQQQQYTVPAVPTRSSMDLWRPPRRVTILQQNTQQHQHHQQHQQQQQQQYQQKLYKPQKRVQRSSSPARNEEKKPSVEEISPPASATSSWRRPFGSVTGPPSNGGPQTLPTSSARQVIDLSDDDDDDDDKDNVRSYDHRPRKIAKVEPKKETQQGQNKNRTTSGDSMPSSAQQKDDNDASSAGSSSSSPSAGFQALSERDARWMSPEQLETFRSMPVPRTKDDVQRIFTQLLSMQKASLKVTVSFMYKDIKSLTKEEYRTFIERHMSIVSPRTGSKLQGAQGLAISVHNFIDAQYKITFHQIMWMLERIIVQMIGHEMDFKSNTQNGTSSGETPSANDSHNIPPSSSNDKNYDDFIPRRHHVTARKSTGGGRMPTRENSKSSK